MKKLSMAGYFLVFCLLMLSLAPLCSAQSWYDDRFDKKYVLTLINNYSDDLVNYPVWVTLNVTGSNNSELRVIYNNSTSLAWINASPYGVGNTIIGFRANISAMSNTSLYEIYFSPNETISSTATSMTDIKGLRGFGNLTSLLYIWSFDNTDTSNLTDISTGLNTGSSYDAVNKSSPIKLLNGSCFSDGCYDMNNSGMMRMLHAHSFVPYVDAEAALSCWVYPKSMSSTNYIMGNDNAVSGRGQFKIGTDGSLFWGLYDGSGDYPSRITISGLITSGRWYHVLARYNNTGDRWSIYVDGLAANGTTTEPTNAVNNANGWNVGIGSYTYNAATYSNEILDECAIWNDSIDDRQIKHYALYYNIASEAEYETPLSLPPTLPVISPIPNPVEQNTSVSVNWTASNITGASVEYNLTLYDNQSYTELWSIVTPNLTFNYNATEALDDYIFGIYAKDNEFQESNISWSNSFRICAENFTCTHFHSCDANNASICLEVTDVGCGHAFTGNLTDFDEDCVYIYDDRTTIFNFNLNQLNAVFILFVVAFLWLGVMGIAFMFQNQGFEALGIVLGIVLGLMFSQISWLITIVFIFINIIIMVFFRPSD